MRPERPFYFPLPGLLRLELDELPRQEFRELGERLQQEQRVR